MLVLFGWFIACQPGWGQIPHNPEPLLLLLPHQTLNHVQILILGVVEVWRYNGSGGGFDG
jgi:hypothetical protein